MKKGCSIKEEPEDQVIAASYRARQVKEDMTVTKHKTGELEEQVVQLKEQMLSMQQDLNKKHEDLLSRLSALMLPMQQEFNKKHDDLLARLDSLCTLIPTPYQQQQQMLIDVIMIDSRTNKKSKPYRLIVNSSETVDVLQLKVYQTTGVPPDKQKLRCRGERLYLDGRSLSDYGVQNGSVVTFYCCNLVE